MSKITISDDLFDPQAVHDHFMELTKRSHPSGEEDEVRKYVVECIKNMENIESLYYNPDAKDPGERVIILRRRGSGKYANEPYVTLQAHMDMVCSPNKEIFPLHVFGYFEKDSGNPDNPDGIKWIKALKEENIENPEDVFDSEKGTTLGADDGIGVATILALLEDNELKNYPIECLFTVQEETDMGGAKNFDPSLLKGKMYINLDAEVVDTIIYGSAGGCGVQYQGEVTLSRIPDGFINLKLSISGLQGGHSGININSGRLNAIKVLTEILIRLNKRLTNIDAEKLGVDVKGIKSYDLRLVSFQRDEDPISNKIPSCASAIIAIPGADKEMFEDDFKAYCEALRVQSQPEECLAYEIEEVTQNSLDKTSTDALLCLLQQIPHGVIRMIPNKPNQAGTSKQVDTSNLVETSSNLANITLPSVLIKSSNRSSDLDSMNSLIQIQKAIGELFEYTVETSDPYPPWKPNDNSYLLGKAQEVYKNIYGKKDTATVIHAGLECSYVVQKCDKIDCISIGPTILYPHTGGERLQADTVEPFYNAVSNLIQKIFSK